VNLSVLGCSHRNTPIAVRERLALTADQACSVLGDLRAAYPGVEVVVVSTCNRVEIYTGRQDGLVPSRRQVAELLGRFHGIDPARIFDHLFEQSGHEAIRHLFLVASSLDSMVLGEPQILAQVKQAYQLSAWQSAAGPLTHNAFQAALRVARRVANETAIHRHRVSVPSVAVADFARQIFERFDDKRVLVIGAGDMAEETLRYLRDEGARHVTIVNRSAHRAAELAERWRGQARVWEQLLEVLAEADLVISTTAATEPVVTSEQFRRVASARRRWPMLILDLAVPRDFDPQIDQWKSVFLYAVDDLKEACQQNRQLRDRELPAAMKIIDQETRRFMAQQNQRAIGPVVRQLREGWEEPKQAELDRLLAKLPDLSAKGRAEVRRSFDRLVNERRRPPIESLRKEAGSDVPTGLVDAVGKLFRLKDTV